MVMGAGGWTRAIGGGGGVPTTYAHGEGWCSHHPAPGPPRHAVAGDIMRPVAQGLLQKAKGVTSS